MASKIALLYSDSALAQRARKIISSYDEKFEIGDIQLSARMTRSDIDLLAKTLKSYDGALFCGMESNARIPSLAYLQKSLGLYASAHRFRKRINARADDDFWIVYDGVGEIFDAKSGYATNYKFGREAFDETRCSELEIERTARIAYEIAQRQGLDITLADKADLLETSRLYRKIVTDINEDYPNVWVSTEYVQNAIASIISDKSGVLLLPNAFAEIALCVADRAFERQHALFLGDTAFACCVCASDAELPDACKDLLNWSFDIN